MAVSGTPINDFLDVVHLLRGFVGIDRRAHLRA